MAEISIIIPCYNVEEYIDRCLESVAAQTIGLDMLEIIVINDASTDNTLNKLYQWEQRFPENIMVITYEENLRQGGARNIGLEYASGQYVGFVDADDWIDKDMFRLLYEKMCTGKYDVVKCKYVREICPGQYSLSEDKRQDVEYAFTPRNGFYYGRVAECGNCGSYGGLWTGLYKKSLIEVYDIRFPEKLAYEDNFFCAVLDLYIGSLYILDKVLYHYFVNLVSTSTSSNALHQLDRLSTELMLIDAFKERGAFNLWHDEIERDFLQRFYLNTWYIVFTRFSYIPDIFSDMKKSIMRLFPDYAKNPYLKEQEEPLLELLEMNPEPRTEELETIRDKYLHALFLWLSENGENIDNLP